MSSVSPYWQLALNAPGRSGKTEPAQKQKTMDRLHVCERPSVAAQVDRVYVRIAHSLIPFCYYALNLAFSV